MFLTIWDADLSFELLKSFRFFREYHYCKNLSSEIYMTLFNLIFSYNVHNLIN